LLIQNLFGRCFKLGNFVFDLKVELLNGTLLCHNLLSLEEGLALHLVHVVLEGVDL